MLNPWNVTLKRGDRCWYTIFERGVPVWRIGVVLAFLPDDHSFDIVDDTDDVAHRVYQAWVCEFNPSPHEA